MAVPQPRPRQKQGPPLREEALRLQKAVRRCLRNGKLTLGMTADDILEVLKVECQGVSYNKRWRFIRSAEYSDLLWRLQEGKL